jgi:hypothetical protein
MYSSLLLKYTDEAMLQFTSNIQMDIEAYEKLNSFVETIISDPKLNCGIHDEP